jgi:hypothetical protein
MTDASPWVEHMVCIPVDIVIAKDERIRKMQAPIVALLLLQIPERERENLLPERTTTTTIDQFIPVRWSLAVPRLRISAGNQSPVVEAVAVAVQGESPKPDTRHVGI